jgi:integrase/recombinase XerD
MILLKLVISQFKEYLTYTEKSGETIKGYMKELNKMQKHIQTRFNYPPYLKDITLNDLEEYLASQLLNGLAPASRSFSYHIIRSFYNYCYKKELVDRNIALSLEGIKIKRKERTYLVEWEVISLLDEIESSLIRTAVTTIYYTGLRISECTNLKVKDVDIEKEVIHVIAGKGNKDRDIPMSSKLKVILTDYVENKRPDVDSDRFFATKKTGKLSPQYINRQLADAVLRLGWDKHVSGHIMRHSFASKLIQMDVNLVKIQKLLGHADLRVTSIYTHTSTSELRQAVNEI